MSNTIQKCNALSAEIPFKLDKKAEERNFKENEKITGISPNETDTVIFVLL